MSDCDDGKSSWGGCYDGNLTDIPVGMDFLSSLDDDQRKDLLNTLLKVRWRSPSNLE